MKALKLSLLTVLISLMVACSTLGVPSPTTFNSKVEVGYVTAETLANTTTVLYNGGKLSKADAQNILDQVVNVKAGLDIARSVHDTSPELGDSKLAAALVALRALQTYIGGVK